MHLDRPGLARTPAFTDELFRCRRECIRYRAPDIDAAVAIKIDGIFVEFRWQELREAHGAAPGRTKVGAWHAVLQHLQGMQEFVTEKILALADIGLGRKHADGVPAAKFARVTAFTRPDRQQDIAGYANFSLDPRQGVAVLHREFFTARSERLECSLAQILRRRLHEFRLLRLLLRFARNGKIGKRKIRLEAAHSRIEGRARDAERLGVRPYGLKPAVECSVGTGGNGRE